MATEERKESWKRNAISRRERIVAEGGHVLAVLLEADGAAALNGLVGTSAGNSYKEVITGLLLKEARRRKVKTSPARAGDRSK